MVTDRDAQGMRVGHVKDLRTIRTLMDELRMSYRRAMDTKVHMDFTEKSNSFNFSIAS